MDGRHLAINRSSNRDGHTHIRFYGLLEDVFEIQLHEPVTRKAPVPEALVQDIWQNLSFDQTDLRTTSGKPMQILFPGHLNTDEGPDFQHAKIKIDGQLWRGDVEIHITPSAWAEHGHHRNGKYNSVVLHVALDTDVFSGTLQRSDGSGIDELILGPLLKEPLRKIVYAYHRREESGFPCAGSWQSVPEPLRHEVILELGIRRMHEKKARLAREYLEDPRLDTLLQRLVFGALGYSKNMYPMQELARRVPHEVCQAADTAEDLEALLLGVAGLIPQRADLLYADRASADYAEAARERFEMLNQELRIPPMPENAWRFFRMRPQNFPTLRIAQAAALYRSGALLNGQPFDHIEYALGRESPLESLRSLLKSAPSGFWTDHVRIGRMSAPYNPVPGKQRIDTIILNILIPAILFLADQNGKPWFEEQAFELLRLVPAESDEITRRFRQAGTGVSNALLSQGLHELYRNRCGQGRCLDCTIGQYLLAR